VTSLVRRFLKTAIVFLIAGLAIGEWMLVERELTGRLASSYVTSAHAHAILVGFVMMMILGVVSSSTRALMQLGCDGPSSRRGSCRSWVC
jgi:hypothetical protein